MSQLVIDPVDKPELPGRAAARTSSAPPLWVAILSLCLGGAWLLPNHTQPWLTFHADAWTAAILWAVGMVVLVRRGKLALSVLDLVLLGAALLPFLQLAMGLLAFRGQAWISFAYMFGLLLAVLAGRQWQAWKPEWLGRLLFGGLLFASIVSVGLQLYQWMGLTQDLDVFDIWVLRLVGSRPYANLGQPNQLATLLLWGLLACGWFVQRKHLGMRTGMLVSALLVFGLALTQSRAGLLGLLIVAAGLCWWRRLWPQQRAHRVALLLLLMYLSSFAAVHWVSAVLLLDDPSSLVVRTAGEQRFALWAMLVDAALERPWLGYGWNGVLAAHLAVGERHPDFPALFAHAHNLPLDLVIWAGIPMGLALSAVLLAWTWRVVRDTSAPEHLLYLLLLLTFGAHAMLELPHHYAYLLLPAGFAMGALTYELRIWMLAKPSGCFALVALAAFTAGGVLLVCIAHDYFRLEASTLDVRMKAAKIRSEIPPTVPDVLVLDQLSSMLRFALSEPGPAAPPEVLKEARQVTSQWITYPNLLRLVKLLAINKREAEARCWAAKAMVMVTKPGRPMLLAEWRKFREGHPQLEEFDSVSTAKAAQACAAVSDSELGPYPNLHF